VRRNLEKFVRPARGKKSLQKPLRFVVMRFQVVEESLVLTELRRSPQPRAHAVFERPLTTLRSFAPNVAR